jgi:hypothetical protein
MKILTFKTFNENQNTFPKKHKEIIDFVEANSYFTYYGPEEEQLLFNTRKNGSVGEEEASQIDIQEGRNLARKLLKEFQNIQVQLEIVDEWVHVTVKEKVEKVDEYKYIFKKDMNGAGFSEGFETMDLLIKRFRNWIDVDWDDIKTKVESINTFPEDTFYGWHRSRSLLIKKAGEEGNKFGYNFYIIKSKKD